MRTFPESDRAEPTKAKKKFLLTFVVRVGSISKKIEELIDGSMRTCLQLVQVKKREGGEEGEIRRSGGNETDDVCFSVTALQNGSLYVIARLLTGTLREMSQKKKMNNTFGELDLELRGISATHDIMISLTICQKYSSVKRKRPQ